MVLWGQRSGRVRSRTPVSEESPDGTRSSPIAWYCTFLCLLLPPPTGPALRVIVDTAPLTKG